MNEDYKDVLDKATQSTLELTETLKQLGKTLEERGLKTGPPVSFDKAVQIVLKEDEELLRRLS